MSLVAGHGPLGRTPAGTFTPAVPADVVYVEPHPRRVQALLGGRPVIDTEDALMVHRPGHPLSYAFPARAVGALPREPVPEAPGYVHVAWDSVDTWLEEGRELVHYPPNPYHRLDCRPTSRRLHVSIAERTLADTSDTVIVFETALPARLYVAPARVDTTLLRRSATTSYCNYKGWATYWSAIVGDTVVEDVAWSYEDPPAEARPITSHFSFDETRVDVVAQLPGGG